MKHKQLGKIRRILRRRKSSFFKTACCCISTLTSSTEYHGERALKSRINQTWAMIEQPSSSNSHHPIKSDLYMYPNTRTISSSSLIFSMTSLEACM